MGGGRAESAVRVNAPTRGSQERDDPMTPDVEISVIVPCLNEEQNIPTLLQKLDDVLDYFDLSAEILIVDDCSDDYTFREAFVAQSRHPRVRALHRGLPRGIGNAIRFGIEHARGRMGVVVMGDCVDPLTAIPDFRRLIVEEGHHLALLCRHGARQDLVSIPWLYRFYQFWYRWLARVLIGLPLKDPTYAFRAFDIPYVRSLGLNSPGFEVSPEITFRVFQEGGRIGEIRGSQGRRLAGESKFVFSRAGWGYARVLVEAFLRRPGLVSKAGRKG